MPPYIDLNLVLKLFKSSFFLLQYKNTAMKKGHITMMVRMKMMNDVFIDSTRSVNYPEKYR